MISGPLSYRELREMGPWFDSSLVPYVAWIEFVVGSFLALRVYSLGSMVFLPPQKRNSNLTRMENPRGNQLSLVWLLV